MADGKAGGGGSVLDSLSGGTEGTLVLFPGKEVGDYRDNDSEGENKKKADTPIADTCLLALGLASPVFFGCDLEKVDGGRPGPTAWIWGLISS